MSLALLLYVLLVTSLLAAAASIAESALAKHRRATRWPWIMVLVLGALAPWAPTRRIVAPHEVPEPVAAPASGRAVAVGTPMPAGAVARVRADLAPSFETPGPLPVHVHVHGLDLTAVAVGTSLAATGALGLAVLLLYRRRRTWRRARCVGQEVWVSAATGPALFGILRPQIVLPQWVLSLPVSSQRAVVAHECAHIAARDPLLLAVAGVAFVVTPWNPVTWWSVRQLRRAIELDCDQRVVAAGHEARAYSRCLLEVAERATAPRLSTIGMLSPYRSNLERRIAHMTTPPARLGRIGTVLASASALLLTAIACTTNPPAKLAPEVSVVRVDTSAGSAPRWTTKVLFSTAAVDSLALWYAFGAVFANDTSLLVGSTGTIWRISGDGARVQRVAVEGTAPGQFQRIMRMVAAADGSILIGDIYNDSSMTQIMPDGRLLRVIPRGDGGRGPREVEPITALPDGRVITSWWQWRPNRGEIAGIPAGQVERDSVPLLVQDGAGRGLRTLGVWPGLERARLQVEGEVWRLPVPNARSVVYGSRGSTTVIGVSDSIDLTILDGTTPTHRLVAAARRRAATQTERSAWERTVERDHPDEAPRVLAAEQHVQLNDFLPDVGGVVVDGERNVWVGNYAAAADSTRTWVVYSPEGKARGTVELPTYREALVPWRTELLDVYGDRLVVLRGDTPGARYVEVRQLVRR